MSDWERIGHWLRNGKIIVNVQHLNTWNLCPIAISATEEYDVPWDDLIPPPKLLLPSPPDASKSAYIEPIKSAPSLVDLALAQPQHFMVDNMLQEGSLGGRPILIPI